MTARRRCSTCCCRAGTAIDFEHLRRVYALRLHPGHRQPCAGRARACSRRPSCWRSGGCRYEGLIGALLLFRICYYLVPFVIALLLLGAMRDRDARCGRSGPAWSGRRPRTDTPATGWASARCTRCCAEADRRDGRARWPRSSAIPDPVIVIDASGDGPRGQRRGRVGMAGAGRGPLALHGAARRPTSWPRSSRAARASARLGAISSSACRWSGCTSSP